jgi:hypothetical protein
VCPSSSDVKWHAEEGGGRWKDISGKWESGKNTPPKLKDHASAVIVGDPRRITDGYCIYGVKDTVKDGDNKVHDFALMNDAALVSNHDCTDASPHTQGGNIYAGTTSGHVWTCD